MSTDSKSNKELAHVRDTVESVYVAIVLAFVLRAFLIEAFVIPTGSMANSLYGEHYQLSCPCCHYEYAFGKIVYPDSIRNYSGNAPVIPAQAVCPNCGYSYDQAPHAKGVFECGGDRVLVMKYLYDFADPEPWDVVVFKNPQNNRENYIKRIIGLPGESIEIVQGDVFVRKGKDQPWKIRRKPKHAQDVMWLILFDNDMQPDRSMAEVEGLELPEWKETGQKGLWNLTGQGGRVFAYNGGNDTGVLEFFPGNKNMQLGPFRPVNGYNELRRENDRVDEDTDVCTDWQLSAVITPNKPGQSQVAMTFECYENRFRAEFNADGKVRLLYQPRKAGSEDAWTEWASKKIDPFEPGQGRRVALCHVDFRLSLLVDGEVVLSSNDEQYNNGYAKAVARANLPQRIKDNASQVAKLRAAFEEQPGPMLQKKLEKAYMQRTDLTKQWEWFQKPRVMIDAKGEPLEMSHVKLQRDVYYTSPYLQEINGNGAHYDYVDEISRGVDKGPDPNHWSRGENGSYRAWGTRGNPITLRKYAEKPSLDEFFCIGDNSSQSHDGRNWTAAAPSLQLYDENGNFLYQLGTVPRYNILGKALLVYWPAGFRLPVFNWPIVPNVGRMRLIR